MIRALPYLWIAFALAAAFHLGRAIPAEPAAAAGWETVASLERPRAFARAVALPDGDILVVGGLDPADPQVTTYRSELIEAATGRVSVLPQPLLGRVNHSATAGWGDRVVVAGGTEWRGTHWGAVDRVEVYLPGSRTWLRGAPLAVARSDHGAVALADGRILVTGGNQGSALLRSSEIYDPATDRWSAAAPLPRPRTQFSIARLPDGRVLVAGGFREDGRITDTTAIYDPATDRWSEGPRLLDARLNHAMVALPGGDLLFIGGEAGASGTAERYDFRRGRFVAAGQLASPRLVAQAAVLDDGSVLVAGGLAYPGRGAFSPLEDAELWDPRTATWSPVSDPPSARAYGVLVPTERGLFRVSGSGDGEEAVRTIERYRR